MTTKRKAGREKWERLNAIAALVELSSLPVEQCFPHLMPDGERVTTWTEAEAWCAARTGRSLRTIQRIWSTFRRSGRAALARKIRSDKGKSRFFENHPAGATFAAYLFLTWTRNVRRIHAAMEQESLLLGIENGQLPSYTTLRQWLYFTARRALVSAGLRGQALYRGHLNAEAKRRLSSRKNKKAA